MDEKRALLKCKIKNLSFEGKETIWENETMLVTSIFSFSQNDVKRLFCRSVRIWDCVVNG